MAESEYEKEEYLEQDEEEIEGNGRRKALVALLVVAVLVGATLFVVQKLRIAGDLQDCMMTRATNCNDLVAPPKPLNDRRL
ncbi:MAG: hypothetical protein JOY81_10100 [Alphaproteobacteria bacterium]|nr:hypothetical protein [Alphaproteobacteria bacterium]